MKNLFSIIAILCMCLSASAQNTGFAGKRVVLKLDAYSSALNKFPNVGAELIVTRGLTLSLDYLGGNANVKQRYYYDQQRGEDVYLIEAGYGRQVMPEKAKVSHSGFVVSLRKYMGTQKLIPAPHGMFFTIGYKRGNLKEISGMVDESKYAPIVDGSFNLPANYKEYKAYNISYFGIQTGLGRQFFINNYLTIDFLMGFCYNKFDMSLDRYGNQVISGVTSGFGPNVLRIHTGKNPYDISDSNIGLFMNLGVGVMLF